MWYHISEPNSYLAVTGLGIDRVKIVKKCLVLPFQKVTKISITPFDFTMALHAMTSEKLQFSLPAVFTIGPDDNLDALTKYAVLLTGDSDGMVKPQRKTVATGRNHVQEIVRGVIEGETRSIVSNMTMEELFNNRRIFKREVLTNVQHELDQFGLRIYNANVKELQDMGDSHYFESLARKAHEGAQSQAQVDVAHARMLGSVGSAEKEGETKQKIAKINAQTAVLETERKVEKANADQKLRTREIEIERELKLETIAAERMAQQRDVELQRTIEEKRAATELERLRATTVTQAKIARESAQQQADADLYTQAKRAEAELNNRQAEAEAIYYRGAKDADVTLYSKQKEAEALLATKEKEAAAMYIIKEREAEAAYLSQTRQAEASYIAKKNEAAGISALSVAYGELSTVLGGPQYLMQYLMLTNNTYEKLARANADAIRGLEPKITVWNTGSGGEADTTAPIRNLFQSLPPLFSTIQEQTGIAPPTWLAQMPPSSIEQAAVARKQAKVNGH